MPDLDPNDPNHVPAGKHRHACARAADGCRHWWPCPDAHCPGPEARPLFCFNCHPTSVEKRGDPLAKDPAPAIPDEPPATPAQRRLF